MGYKLGEFRCVACHEPGDGSGRRAFTFEPVDMAAMVERDAADEADGIVFADGDKISVTVLTTDPPVAYVVGDHYYLAVVEGAQSSRVSVGSSGHAVFGDSGDSSAQGGGMTVVPLPESMTSGDAQQLGSGDPDSPDTGE